MATRLTKKQQGELTEKLAGIIRENNALQLRLSMDNSVNEMNVNQISGALNRIHGQAIGKELPTVVNIPVKQLGSGVPSPDNIRSIVGYEITGIGTIYGGDLNIETGVLTLKYSGLKLSNADWRKYKDFTLYDRYISQALDSTSVQNSTDAYCSMYQVTRQGDWRPNVLIIVRENNSNRLSITTDKNKYASVAAFISSLRDAVLVYRPDSPETYTLTPEQMIQLLDQL